MEWAISAGNLGSLDGTLLSAAWMVPSAVSINEKTPPTASMDFGYKRDIEFDFNLPVDGIFKDCKVKISIPILLGNKDVMCNVKDIQGEHYATICRGLLCLGCSRW